MAQDDGMSFGELMHWRVDLAKNILADATPTQKDWYQLGEGARETRYGDERDILMRAYKKAERMLGVVGAGETA